MRSGFAGRLALLASVALCVGGCATGGVAASDANADLAAIGARVLELQRKAAEEVVAVLSGRPPRNPVNPEAWRVAAPDVQP